MTSQRPAKPASASADSFRNSYLPNDLNNHHTVFGGKLLADIDILCGAICRKHCRRPVVTASVEHVDFLAPIYPGEWVTIHGRLIHVGTSSMYVYVRGTAENLDTEEIREVIRGIYTFVAKDPETERPVPVPSLILQTEEERRLEALALRFRERRKEDRELWESL